MKHNINIWHHRHLATSNITIGAIPIEGAARFHPTPSFLFKKRTSLKNQFLSKFDRPILLQCTQPAYFPFQGVYGSGTVVSALGGSGPPFGISVRAVVLVVGLIGGGYWWEIGDSGCADRFLVVF